jgi:hypothetical protein
MRTRIGIVCPLLIGVFCASSAWAASADFAFSGEIAGGDNPGYVVNSSANFSWEPLCPGAEPNFCTLTITLAAETSTSGPAPSQGEVLTALVFDVLGGADFRDGPPGNVPFGGTVTASALEGSGAATALGEIGLDVSAHWGLNPAIQVDSHGSHLLSSVVDAFGGFLAGGDTLRSIQLFPGTISSIEPSPPDGSNFGIIDAGSSSGGIGWPAGSLAYVQDEIVVTLLYEGILTGVDDVEPLYGTTGLPVPEPTTTTGVLFGVGLLGLLRLRRRSSVPAAPRRAAAEPQRTAR